MPYFIYLFHFVSFCFNLTSWCRNRNILVRWVIMGTIPWLIMPWVLIQYNNVNLTSIGNSIVEIRRSYDCLISTVGFPILLRWHLYTEPGPWLLALQANQQSRYAWFRKNGSLSSMRKYFNYLCHLSFEKCKKMQTCDLMFPRNVKWIEFSTTRVNCIQLYSFLVTYLVEIKLKKKMNKCFWWYRQLHRFNMIKVTHRHRKIFWAFTGPRIDFGLILLISNMIIHKSFTDPTHL